MCRRPDHRGQQSSCSLFERYAIGSGHHAKLCHSQRRVISCTRNVTPPSREHAIEHVQRCADEEEDEDDDQEQRRTRRRRHDEDNTEYDEDEDEDDAGEDEDGNNTEDGEEQKTANIGSILD